MKILIIGASGMLGHSLFTNLSKYNHEVYGTVRSSEKEYFGGLKKNIFQNINLDIDKINQVESLIKKINPDYLINCIGIIKQKKLSKSENKKQIIYVNSYLPYLLSDIAERNNCRFIHFSTDCVFSGAKGGYIESDKCDVNDTYGLTKFLGEITHSSSLTIRTSIIGHELDSNYSLVDWFLSQETKEVKGFSKAIFSGLPTCYVSLVLDKFIFGKNLSGLYHLSVDPIDKFSLLCIINKHYDKRINIIEDSTIKIDRSLSSEKLKRDTGYNYDNWETLITLMRKDRLENFIYESKKT